jgi:hypothetical protein
MVAFREAEMNADNYRLLWKDGVLAALCVIAGVYCATRDAGKGPSIFIAGIALSLIV